MRYPATGDLASITTRHKFADQSCSNEELKSIHDEKRRLKHEAVQNLRSGKWASAYFAWMTVDGDRISFSPKD